MVTRELIQHLCQRRRSPHDNGHRNSGRTECGSYISLITRGLLFLMIKCWISHDQGSQLSWLPRYLATSPPMSGGVRPKSSLKQEKTMLTSISRNSNWTTVALIGLFATVLFSFQDARAAQPKQLTKKEVVALITTAKSPEDHMQLARYYKAEADRLEVEAKDHDELAATS